MKQTAHVLERTSPTGEPFVGECILCGVSGLTARDANKPCENTFQLSVVESLVAAIEGPGEDPKL